MKKLLMTGAALLVMASSAQAVVLFEDNFEGNVPGLAITPSGWTVTSGSVDVVPLYPGEGNQVDLDGTTNNGGAIETVAMFDLVAGRTYSLSFDFGKNGAGLEALSYNVGSFGSGIFSNVGAIPNLLGTSFTFLALANEFGVKLNFASFFSSDNEGLVIDNVRLEELTPIPLPPAVLLLATGLAGLGGLARKRKS